MLHKALFTGLAVWQCRLLQAAFAGWRWGVQAGLEKRALARKAAGRLKNRQTLWAWNSWKFYMQITGQKRQQLLKVLQMRFSRLSLTISIRLLKLCV